MEGDLKTQKGALAAAVEMEQKGREFYTESAKRSDNQHVTDIFTFLAGEELKHIEAIKEFYNNELSGGKSDFDSIVTRVDPKRAIASVWKLFESFQKDVPVDKSDLDALGFARDFERKGEEFYRLAALNSRDEQVKKLFSFLVEEEQRHFKMVDDSMAYLENPEEWFHRRERWHVEG